MSSSKIHNLQDFHTKSIFIFPSKAGFLTIVLADYGERGK